MPHLIIVVHSKIFWREAVVRLDGVIILSLRNSVLIQCEFGIEVVARSEQLTLSF
jgi:hypothetical protein